MDASFFILLRDPWWFTALACLLGLMVGSFLNVVIYRLPLMIEREWRGHCAELLERPEFVPSGPVVNLLWPGSRCPHCGHAITALENIPVLSYLFQRGRCTACAKPISLRYPAIEILSALLAGVVAWHFGFGWAAAGGLLLTWALVALSGIDFDRQLLPDDITLPLLWLGLLANLFQVYTDLSSAVIGAMAGYLFLWGVFWVFKLLTGKDGMGYGDFKLLAAFGAWLGWQMLPVILLLSSLAGAVIGLALVFARGRDKNIPIPFGPYLAAAGWIALLWGRPMMDSYLGWNSFPT